MFIDDHLGFTELRENFSFHLAILLSTLFKSFWLSTHSAQIYASYSRQPVSESLQSLFV